MFDRENNQQITKLPPWFGFCFGNILRLRVRVQVSLLSFFGQANNGVACLRHVESEAPRMRIDIQKAEHVPRGLPGRTKSVKRFERSAGLDTALYKNYLFTFSCVDVIIRE